MIDDENHKLLEFLRRSGEEVSKLDPLVYFQQLVDDGIIDSEGRLRPEITGLGDQDGPEKEHRK